MTNAVIAMIETAEGLKNVGQIAAVPGVDVLWLGHFDLTSSMGIAGQLDHPDYILAVKTISAAAAAHNKLAGYMAMNKDFASHYWNEGYKMLAYGLDHLYCGWRKTGWALLINWQTRESLMTKCKVIYCCLVWRG